MTLIDLLEESAERHPSQTALTMRMGFRVHTLTYGDVLTFSYGIADYLEAHDIQKGDRVLLFAPNSPYYACAYFAVMLRGGVLVPLNVQSTSEQIAKIAEQTDAKLIIKSLYLKRDFPRNLPSEDIELLIEDTDLGITHFTKTDISPNDLSLIMYTSGTTGDPKGVMLTHDNIMSNLESVSALIPISKRDRFLSILPLSHMLEQMGGLLVPFSRCASITYAHSPADIGELIKEKKITKMVTVPEFLKVMMDRIIKSADDIGKGEQFRSMLGKSLKFPKWLRRMIFRKVHKKLGGHLKFMVSGGAPLDCELEKNWNALGITVFQGYGLTETSPIISTNTPKDHAFGSVGKPLPNLEVKFSDDGEILVKGSNVFKGYYKNHGKTDEVFTDDGFFKTGDSGKIDENGFLYIKGRRKYIILGSGGQNVFPEDIESELNKVDGIKDSCVLGLEKSSGHVEIHAVLLLDKEVDKDLVVSDTNRNLANYQYIQASTIWPKSDFPRSATRKIKKEVVIKWLHEHKDVSDDGSSASPLIHLLADITGSDFSDIKDDSTMNSLNLDSLLRVELVSRIGDEFGSHIDESKIVSETSVKELKDLIDHATPVNKIKMPTWPRSKWIRPFRLFFQSFGFLFGVAPFIKMKINGKEHLKNLRGPVIFMSNHLSMYDFMPILKALPLRFRAKISAAAAEDVFYKKFAYLVKIGELLFNVFRFPRQEGEHVSDGLKNLGKQLDSGHSVMVFPESYISKSGNLQPLKAGTGLIAVEMGVTIVPINIEGIQNIFPYGSHLPKRRGSVTVAFGKPLFFSKRDSYSDATKRIENAMKSI